MKNIFYTIILSSVILTSCNNSTKTDGWVSLFNGKDLTGWKQLGGRNGNAKYEVIDGVIVGTTVANTPNSFLVTEKTYTDFVFEVDLFLEEPMNSGIQFRSLSKDEYKEGRVHGYQCEVDPSSRAWSGGIYDEARRGWLYPMTLNPEGGKSFKLNDWNHYRIECIGSTIRTWLNGVPAAYLIDDLTTEGFIALQIHSVKEGKEGHRIKWKNIRIKTQDLKPYPELEPIFVMNNIYGNMAEAELKDGWQWLWDGKTTSGWKGRGMEQFPSERWEIKNGILAVRALKNQQKVDLISEGKYGSFELQWWFLLTQGATSGILYSANVDQKQNNQLSGVEYQLQDDKNAEDTVEVHSTASLYGLLKAVKKDKFVKATGDWNHARIVVQSDKHVEHWLNGIKVLEYNAADENLKILNSIFDDKGHIVLKDEGTEVLFRDIKIKYCNKE